jgi:hypothetical protein
MNGRTGIAEIDITSQENASLIASPLATRDDKPREIRPKA